MKEKITKTLIATIQPRDKVFEINDTELPGFLARVLPSGTITYIVSYRWQGKRNRVVVGRHSTLSAIQARDEAKKILAAKELGTDPGIKKQLKKAPPTKHTLRSFITSEYKTWCETNKKDGIATVKRILSAFADMLDKPLDKIDILEAERWRTTRLSSGTDPVTVNRDMSSLKSLFTTAKVWKMIEVNSLAGFECLKTDSSPNVRYLDADEESRLFKALVDRETEKIEARENANTWRENRGYPLHPPVVDALQTMVVVSLNTGVRWGTLVQLLWSDIDFDKAILTVRAGTEKSVKTVHIPLNSKAKTALSIWKKAVTCDSQGLIFPGKSGKVKNNVKKAWSGVKERAQIKSFRWHDLRHTFASKLVMNGVDLNTVRELLGHSDIKMTLRYAHLAPEHKAAAVAVL